MLRADGGGEFFDGTEFGDLVADGEGVRSERGGRDGNADFFADAERALVVGFAARNGDDDIGAAEEIVEVETGGGERLLVGLMAEGERAGEEHHTGGIGIGEADGAVMVERHDGFSIWDLGFSI